ncbi:MAG: hypothetical protein L6V95_01180 [Candidatus Melainabacteria bacterium]|nr:MAG: hypothetical protein L6V95_01180 [Candidatus Melainabacteria bacterium]
MAVNFEIIKKAGAWFSYGETKLGQGKEKAKEYLKENPDLLQQIETLVREKLNPQAQQQQQENIEEEQQQ